MCRQKLSLSRDRHRPEQYYLLLVQTVSPDSAAAWMHSRGVPERLAGSGAEPQRKCILALKSDICWHPFLLIFPRINWPQCVKSTAKFGGLGAILGFCRLRIRLAAWESGRAVLTKGWGHVKRGKCPQVSFWVALPLSVPSTHHSHHPSPRILSEIQRAARTDLKTYLFARY